MTQQSAQIRMPTPERLVVVPVIFQRQSLQGNPENVKLLVGEVERQINGNRHQWSPIEGDIIIVNQEENLEIEITEHESVGTAARWVMDVTTGIADAQFIAACQEPLRMATGHGDDDLSVEVLFYAAVTPENLQPGFGDAYGGLKFRTTELVDPKTFRERINIGASRERAEFHHRLADVTGRVLDCIASCYRECGGIDPQEALPRLAQAKLGDDFTGDEFRPAWGLVNPSLPIAPPWARRVPSAAPAP